jgi:hypothetical protein
MQVGLGLAVHGFILWGWFGGVGGSSEVLDMNRALWVICFVGYAAGGTLEGGVDACTSGMAGGDRAEVVACGMLLGAHRTYWFVCFA